MSFDIVHCQHCFRAVFLSSASDRDAWNNRSLCPRCGRSHYDTELVPECDLPEGCYNIAPNFEEVQ